MFITGTVKYDFLWLLCFLYIFVHETLSHEGEEHELVK